MTRELRIGAGFALVAAIGWIALALRTPTNTYHFAPLVVALALPVATRSDAGPAIGRGRKVIVGTIGGLVAALIGLWLAATGNLEGPTLWGDDGALSEVLVFSIGGALAGTGLTWRN